MMVVVRVALGCLLLFGCSSSDEVTRSSCMKLRDHIVDLRVDAYDHMKDPVGRPVDIKPYRATLKQALGDKFIDTCVASMSPSQLRCGLDAKTSSAAVSCSNSH
jgi:hypothetical protein